MPACAMNVTTERMAAGQAVYTRRVLQVYALIVLGLSNRLLWKCPTARLIERCNRHALDEWKRKAKG
jgi:hypothetical protein